MSSVHNKKNGIQFFDTVKTDLSLLSYWVKILTALAKMNIIKIF